MESNWLAWLILTALIITFLVETVAELFNLSTLTPEPPPGLADVYPPEEYARSQRYTKAKTRFGLLTGAFDLAITVAFWLAGGFAWLDLWVRGLNLGQVVSGLTYLGS
ncbi:MAG: M48 family peptidase, partial [Desulfobacteraceae bacterium]|nr:M48 family peptidase [Desulfobacteraceae bacterium]